MEEALIEWALKCPLFNRLEGFGTEIDEPHVSLDAPLLNYLRENEGACALRPVAGAAAATGYIGGGRLVAYDFYLELMLSMSITTDRANALNMLLGRLWQSWLMEMESNSDYPDFGDECAVVELACLSNMPQVAQLYDGGMARYHFPARLFYVEN